jgi:hypothetical protein
MAKMFTPQKEAMDRMKLSKRKGDEAKVKWADFHLVRVEEENAV